MHKQVVEVLLLVCTRGRNVWLLYNLSDVSSKNRNCVSDNRKQKLGAKELSQERSDVWQLLSDFFVRTETVYIYIYLIFIFLMCINQKLLQRNDRM